MTVCATLSACGGSSRPAGYLTSNPCDYHTCYTPPANGLSYSPTPVTSTPSTADTTEPAPSALTTLGTATLTTAGDTVTTTFAVGQPQLGTVANVPGAVLSTCRFGSPDTMVWIHGSVTVSYLGSISQQIGFLTPTVTLITEGSNPITQGQVAIAGLAGGGWNGCVPPGGTTASNQWSYTFHPGGTETMDMWIGYQLISNTNPTFTPEQANALQLSFAAFALDQYTAAGTTTWTGPRAANCDDRNSGQTGRVLLYATAPVTYNFNVYGRDETTTCTPA